MPIPPVNNDPVVRPPWDRGGIAWMTRNRVTPNLIMLVLLVGGLFMGLKVKKEIFPSFVEDTIEISVSYPGASPEEIERGIVTSVEEAIRGLEGIKQVSSNASEGSGKVTAELDIGVERQEIYQNIQQEIDRIRTFPEDAEDPKITLNVRRRDVMEIQIYGDVPEWNLREIAERARDRLLQDPGISQVEFENVPGYEVHINVSKEALRAHDLTLEDIANRIDTMSVELPGGALKTTSGELLLRVSERRDWAEEFGHIPIISTQTGESLKLGDIATVSEGFAETTRHESYNGAPALEIKVYRVGDQTPISVSDAARAALKDLEGDMPPDVGYAITDDDSEIYRLRLALLLKNGFLGLALVILLLGALLNFRLAFWVTLGIPTSFLGAMLFLPSFDGFSINVISLFAFIIAMGIVVDDAIVAGENIFEYRQKGMSFYKAAVKGAQDVMLPITFSILTNIVAFLPLAFIPGRLGKFWGVIPIVVGVVFIISWVEALIILPSHLAHGKKPKKGKQSADSTGLGPVFQRFVQRRFGPFLKLTIRHRYVTFTCAITLLAVICGYAMSGRMGFILMPKIESDSSAVTVKLPYGSPLADGKRIEEKLLASAQEVANHNGGDDLLTGIYSRIRDNQIEVFAHLTPSNTRPISTTDFTTKWRDALGELVGPESVRFESDRGGPGRGASITIELSHSNIDVLDRASEALAAKLSEYATTKDIDDGYSPGKPQFSFTLKPEAQSLGLTSREIGKQVRNAFYGAEALRQQRGRNEIKVLVRYPLEQRSSEYDVEQMLIRTPQGGEVPLATVASLERGRAYTSIQRREGRRTVEVTSNVDPIDDTNRVLASLQSNVLPQLVRDYPGLSYSFEGRQAEMRESLEALVSGLIVALLVIYVLLAIPFKSYIQPLIVMIAIPFGTVGAVIGHELMGYNISLISILGMVALTGVVVNDSLVMIDYANKRRKEPGVTVFEAIFEAGIRRFRPIMLTTLTTFGGLAPMIFETSRQARFIIPMAISLGYGIIFATAITLIIVPSVYMIIEDLRRLQLKLRRN